MIRCALADSLSPLTSMPRRRRPSSSPISTAGSTTTPLPITQVLPGCRIPDGIRWNLNVSPSRTIVWPALLPPWKRTTIGGALGEQVDDLALALVAPLGPDDHDARHQPSDYAERAPARAGLRQRSGGPRRRAAASRTSRPAARPCARRSAPRAAVDLEVGGDEHRAVGRVALVDDRVELLEHPVGALLGAEVVDVQQVDRGQAARRTRGRRARRRRRRRCGGSAPAGAAASRSRPSARPRSPSWRPASPASSCRCRRRPRARGRGPRRSLSSSSSM